MEFLLQTLVQKTAYLTQSQLVLEEIKTFNIGLTLIGNSYQATLREKRDSGLVRTGTIIIDFPDEN